MYHFPIATSKTSMESQPTPTRRRVTSADLRRELAELRAELQPLRRHYQRTVRAAINALPDAARRHYLGLPKVASEDGLGDFLYELKELVLQSAQLLPEKFPGAERRVACPLCVSNARGPFQGRGDGWGAEKGLESHLKRDTEENGCHVMQTLQEHARREYESRLKAPRS